MATTWNPADKDSGMTLSNGNLTVTGATGGKGTCARGTLGQSAGKWYYEIVISSYVQYSSPEVGIAAISGDITTDGAMNVANTIIYDASFGNLGNAGGWIQSPGAAAVNGDVIGIAVDMDNGYIDFTKNNVAIGTRISGIKTGIATAYPIISEFNGKSSTARFAAGSLTYAPPSGYNAWDYVAAPADHGFMMQLLNGVISAMKGAAKNAISYFDGSKWVVKEGGTTGQVLGIDSNGDLNYIAQTGGTGTQIAVQNDAPSSPATNALWVDADAPSPAALTTVGVAEDVTNLYFTQARAIAAALAGLVTTDASDVAAANSIVAAIGKLQAQSTKNKPFFFTIPINVLWSLNSMVTIVLPCGISITDIYIICRDNSKAAQSPGTTLTSTLYKNGSSYDARTFSGPDTAYTGLTGITATKGDKMDLRLSAQGNLTWEVSATFIGTKT